MRSASKHLHKWLASLYHRPTLFEAVEQNKGKRLIHLLERGADANSIAPNGLTLCCLAAQYGRHEMLTDLIAHGANASLPGRFNCTPTHYAIIHHRPSIVSLLHRHQVKLVTTGHGRPALHVAARLNDADMVQYLLDTTNIDVNQRDPIHSPYETALHIAASLGHIATLKILLQYGAEPTLCNRNEQTCLEVATNDCIAYLQAATRPIDFRWKPGDPDPRDVFHPQQIDIAYSLMCMAHTKSRCIGRLDALSLLFLILAQPTSARSLAVRMKIASQVCAWQKNWRETASAITRMGEPGIWRLIAQYLISPSNMSALLQKKRQQTSSTLAVTCQL